METDWPCDPNQYDGAFDLTRKLGQGAFSTVYRGTCKPKNVDVAIKVMDLENITTSFEDILLEVQTMKLSNHENILHCYVSFVYETKLWLVLQYMNKGSCLRIMNIAKKEGICDGMNEEWVAYIIKETLKGLNYIHNAGFLHRDIKSGNILLSQYGEVRLADFGVAGWILSRGQRHDNVRTFVGTLCYMSPETMEQTYGYDQKADIWSLGITALELSKGFAPYSKYAPMKVLVMTIEEDPPSLMSYKDNLQPNGQPFSNLFEDFCSKCLQKDPKFRANAEELLRHKFCRGRSKDSLVEQLLNRVPSMDDTPKNTASSQDQEASATSVETESLSNAHGHQISKADMYVAGTTWVFDDENAPSKSSIYRKGMGISGVIGSERMSSSGRTLSISVIRGGALSGQSVVRISQVRNQQAHAGGKEDNNINDFLDDFEIESASMKTKDSKFDTSRIVPNDTDSFFDEIQSIIGKDNPA